MKISKKLYEEAYEMLEDYTYHQKLIDDYENEKRYGTTTQISEAPRSITNRISRPTEIQATKSKDFYVVQAEYKNNIVDLALTKVSRQARVIFEEYFKKKKGIWEIVYNEKLDPRINSESTFKLKKKELVTSVAEEMKKLK